MFAIFDCDFTRDVATSMNRIVTEYGQSMLSTSLTTIIVPSFEIAGKPPSHSHTGASSPTWSMHSPRSCGLVARGGVGSGSGVYGKNNGTPGTGMSFTRAGG